MLGMLGILAACTFALGPLAMFNLYFVPYWVNVVWLDVVTYLHHHGAQDADEKIPWYRGEVCLFPSDAPNIRGRLLWCLCGLCMSRGSEASSMGGSLWCACAECAFCGA